MVTCAMCSVMVHTKCDGEPFFTTQAVPQELREEFKSMIPEDGKAVVQRVKDYVAAGAAVAVYVDAARSLVAAVAPAPVPV